MSGLTCTYAVEVAWREVVDASTLELKRTGAVYGWNRGVGLFHPVNQPFDLTVTTKRVPSQVSAKNGERNKNIHKRYKNT